MHPRYRQIANQFPRYNKWVAETNQAVRQGVLTMSIDQWCNLSHHEQVSIQTISALIKKMVEYGLVVHHCEIRDSVTDELLHCYDSLIDIEPVCYGRIVLPSKHTDYSEFDNDPHFAYMQGVYTFTDLYNTKGNNDA